MEPSIPHNLGAIIRTSACFGINRINIVMPSSFPVDTKAFGRVAMDYCKMVELVKHSSFLDFVKSSSCADDLVLLTTKSSFPYYEHRYNSKSVLVVGNESYGVSDEVRSLIKSQVCIPMVSGARSLNVATSGAIVLSEALRQGGYNLF